MANSPALMKVRDGEKERKCVCVTVWMFEPRRVHACVTVAHIVCVWVDVSDVRLEVQPGGPRASDEDGWMNVNISFTLLSQRLG